MLVWSLEASREPPLTREQMKQAGVHHEATSPLLATIMMGGPTFSDMVSKAS